MKGFKIATEYSVRIGQHWTTHDCAELFNVEFPTPSNDQVETKRNNLAGSYITCTWHESRSANVLTTSTSTTTSCKVS